MSSSTEQLIKKKVHHEGVIKKRANHILYEVVDITETVPIKSQEKSEQEAKPSSREILDNYRYIETKGIGSINERRASIDKHQRLDKTIGKVNPLKRISLKEYRTNTTYIQKRPKEKLVFCRTCGKPKRPKQLQKIENYDQMRNSITREIIGEQSPLGDYFIRYSTQGELNQPSSSQFELRGQGNKAQQRLEENAYDSKTHFCPIHG